MPPDAPVERLIANTSAYVRLHPDDGKGHYTLARIHYLAFSLKAQSIKAWNQGTEDGGRLPQISDMFQREGGGPGAPKPEELRAHLRAALEGFAKALALDPRNGLYHLGLACALEQGAPHAGEMKESQGFPPGDPAAAALASRAIDLSEIRDQVKQLDSKPRGAITPIIFAPDRAARLEELVDDRRTVRFDLDGTGRPQAWSWVKPETAILVWDAKGTGAISSGRQLFGNVTFWMFWEDGYRALDALDDDRDGWLSGKELQGLAGWRDRNANGVAEAGEVTPVAKLGVTGLSTRATGRTGETPMNAAGLRLQDGRVLPTYDWVASPRQGASARF